MDNFDYLIDLTIGNDGYYNLFITTFNGVINTVNINVFLCRKNHEMRMDLVSNELYGTVKYVGSLCQLNDILNPFSIRENDVLFFLPQDDLESSLNVSELLQGTDIDDAVGAIRNDLINLTKRKRPNGARNNFLNNRGDQDRLPPTILPNSTPKIVADNNQIKVAPNLFTTPRQRDLVPIDGDPTTVTGANPNSQDPNNNGAGAGGGTGVGGAGDAGGGAGGAGNNTNIREDGGSLERVLVRRYIKLINN